jgi:hypothetical protein
MGPHDAMKDLTAELPFGRHNFVYEADIEGSLRISGGIG